MNVASSVTSFQGFFFDFFIRCFRKSVVLSPKKNNYRDFFLAGISQNQYEPPIFSEQNVLIYPCLNAIPVVKILILIRVIRAIRQIRDERRQLRYFVSRVFF